MQVLPAKERRAHTIHVEKLGNCGSYNHEQHGMKAQRPSTAVCVNITARTRATVYELCVCAVAHFQDKGHSEGNWRVHPQ